MPPQSQQPAAPERTGWRGRAMPLFALLAIGVVAAVVAVGWGFAGLNFTGTGHSVPHQLLAWRTVSETEVSVRFEVSSDEPSTCVVEATDRRHVEVGRDEVAVEPGRTEVEHAMETTREAASVEVVSCRPGG